MKFTQLVIALAMTMPIVFTGCVSTEQNASTTTAKERYRQPAGKVNQTILNNSKKYNTRVIIDIADQRAFLLVDGQIAINSPVSTARADKHTPRGSFHISERVRSGKVSTIYDVSMPYWMRLSGGPFGLHAGYLPGFPASAGCIRMPSAMARLFFDHTQYGTHVSIQSSWSGG